MNKNLTFKLLGLLLFPLFCYAQVNPRMVDRKYAKTVYLEDFSSNQTFINDWTASYVTKDNSLYSFVDTSATINLDETNGELKLSMLKIPEGYTNSYWGGTFITNFITAEIVSNDYFGYGVYQCNAKFAYDKGSFPAFWLYNDSQCSVSKRNEIDIVECKVDHSSPTLDNNMFYYPLNCGNSDDYGFEQHPFNTWNQSHVFECVYAPDRIEFWVDDVLYHTVWDNDDHRYPDQIMRLILSQQVVRYNGGQSEIVAPQTSTFYWVKAKEFFLAPEITLSTVVVCTTGTATVDVDPAATNISWALTPSNLFSGATNGTGTTANITRASGASGKGKITYTFRMPITMSPYYETFIAEKDIWVGVPQNSKISATVMMGPSGNQLCRNTDMTIAAGHSEATLQGVTKLIWDFGAWAPYFQYFDFGGTVQDSRPVFRLTSMAPASQNIKIYAQNACGYSTQYYQKTFYAVNCGGYFLALSPNPSTGETTVTIVSTSGIEIDETAEWNLEIFDQSQKLKTKKDKVIGKSFKFNTSGWKEGVYIVMAKIGDEIISEKLMVKP